MSRDLDIDAAIAAREAQILGEPQRIPMLADEDARLRAMALTMKLRNAILPSAPPLSADQMPFIMTTLMCHPALWEQVSLLSVQIFGFGVLPRRDVELVFLRVAWICQAPYEWGEHVKQAKMAGVSEGEIEQIIEGAGAVGWGEHDRALMQVAQELRDEAMIADATWDILAKRYDDKQMFELLVLIGQITLVAYFQNGLRLRLEKGNGGLRAR